MIKQIITIAIISIFIGIGVYFFTRENPEINNLSIDKTQTPQLETLPTPTPLPSLPPFDKTSNLEEEVNILTPKDFSGEFQNLRNSI